MSDQSKPKEIDKLVVVVYGLGVTEAHQEMYIRHLKSKLYSSTRLRIMQPIASSGYLDALRQISNKVTGSCQRLPNVQKDVDRIVEMLQKEKNKYNRIILIGHSMGGYIVSRVLETLHKHHRELLSNIDVATAGTIYIPEIGINQNVQLTHYLFEEDYVNRLCNNFSHLIKLHKNDGYIKVLDWEKTYGGKLKKTLVNVHAYYPLSEIIYEHLYVDPNNENVKSLLHFKKT